MKSNNKPLRVLITGGSGFIGCNLINRLLDSTQHQIVNIDKQTYASNVACVDLKRYDAKYEFVDADIGDSPAVSEQLSSLRPQVVLHLAAETHVDRSIDGPSPFIESNVNGTYKLIEVVTRYFQSLPDEERRAFRFIHTSTDEVFGSIPAGEVAGTESPFRPSSPYAASKAAADSLVSAWQHTYQLPCVIVRLSNVYGGYQFPEKMIPVSIIRALRQEPLALYGDGGQCRDWLFVDDAVQAFLSVLDRGLPGSTYQFATGFQVTNHELLELLCRLLDEERNSRQVITDPLGKNSRELITCVDDRPGHDRRYAMDTDLANEELKWNAKYDLEMGLRKTVRWYLDNSEWWEAIISSQYDLKRLGLSGRSTSANDRFDS